MDQGKLWSPNQNNWIFIFAFKGWKTDILLDELMPYEPDPLSVMRDISEKINMLSNSIAQPH